MENTVGLKINEPDVVSETIDGETVVVNLATGSYYSLEGSATAVWSLIESRCSVEQIVSSIAQQFEGELSTISAATTALVEQLQAEKLIVVSGDAADAGAPESVASDSESTEPKLAFVPPSLQKFSDMQELLLLDPIHDVDASEGWPAKEATPAQVGTESA